MITYKYPVAVSPVFIDRLSATLSVPQDEQAAVEQRIESLLNAHHGQKTRGLPQYRHSALFYVGDFGHPAKLHVSWNPKALGAAFVRFDFNPSQGMLAQTQEFIRHISPFGYEQFVDSATCTRIDVSVDVRNASMDELLFYFPGFSKTQAFWNNGRTETVYFGDSQSERRYAIYDKRAELKRKHKHALIKPDIPKVPTTRIEARIRNAQPLKQIHELTNPLSKVHVVYIKQLLQDPFMNLFVAAAQGTNGQDALLRCSESLRKKIKKELSKTVANWWNPDQSWDGWPAVVKQVLKKGHPQYSLGTT